MYQAFFTKKYTKSLDKLQKNGKLRKSELDFVIDQLCGKKELSSKYKDHQLKGSKGEYRECHVHNDILLIYQYLDDKLILVAVDIGTHSQLF